MSVMENMMSHFSDKEISSIEVPEWGTDEKPLVIHYKPFTLAEQKKLYSMAKDDNIEMLAYTLILKALDEEGNKMFTMSDKRNLMNKVDPYILAKVAGHITDSESVEDHLGN